MEKIFPYFSAVIGATLLGGYLPLFVTLVRRRPSIALNFSSGVLIGASFLQLVPETFHFLPENAGLAVLFGFAIFFIMEKFFLVDPCEEADCAVHAIGIPAFFGILLHELADGMALGGGLFVPEVGLIVLLALVFHKIPSAFSLSTILLAARYTRRQVIILLALISLATPLGAVLAIIGFKIFKSDFLGYSLGLAAGTFLAIGTGDLFNQLHKRDERKRYTLTALVAGIFLAYLGSRINR